VEPLLSDPELFFGEDDLPDDPVRVVVADDNPLYRRGLLTALEDEVDLEIVAEAGPGADLVAAVRGLAPDVVVASLTMGQIGGVETAYAVTEVMPLVRVAVLTTDQDPPEKVLAVVRAGALGQLDKVDALEQAARVIRRVHDGWPVLEPATWRALAEVVDGWLGPGDAVSDRERDLLDALGGESSWEGAASALGLRAESARNLARNLLTRVRAAGYGDADRAARGHGLVAGA